MTTSSVRAAYQVSPSTCYAACVALLISSTVLQKIAVPGTGGLIPVSLVVLLVITGALAMSNALKADARVVAAYGCFVAVAFAALAVSQSDHVSTASLSLLCIALAPFVFRFDPETVNYERLMNFVSGLGVLLAAGGLLQLFVQSAMGQQWAFWLDHNLPDAIALKGYNKLNAVAWDVEEYKSNGIFFAEPSCFSQFLALALLAEFMTRARVLWMLTIGAGLLASYSGTGLMTLGVFALFYLPPTRRWQILLAVAVFGVVLFVAGDKLQLSLITSRATEFMDPASSGHARFISIFYLLDRVTFGDAATFLLGRGPGTVTEYYDTQPFDTFAPTWSKVLYEYGAIGFMAYLALFYAAFLRHRTALAWPLAFTFFVLGGYLVDAAMLAQLVVLAGWSARTSEAEEAVGFEARPAPT